MRVGGGVGGKFVLKNLVGGVGELRKRAFII